MVEMSLTEKEMEAVTRVRLMASGDPAWDHSPCDLEALRRVLADRAALLRALRDLVNETHGFLEAHKDDLAHAYSNIAALEQRLQQARAVIAKATLVLLLLLLPSWAHAQDKPFQISKAAFVAAVTADTSATMFVLGQQGRAVREWNPILQPFARTPILFGVVQSAAASVFLVSAQRLHKTHPKVATGLLIGLAVGKTVVAVRTARMVTR